MSTTAKLSEEVRRLSGLVADLRREAAEQKGAISEESSRVGAVLEGQELLKAQTVRIRHAALGGDIPDDRDTEEIVRQLRASLETLATLHGAKLPKMIPSQGLLREPAKGNGDKPFPGRPNKSPGIA